MDKRQWALEILSVYGSYVLCTRSSSWCRVNGVGYLMERAREAITCRSVRMDSCIFTSDMVQMCQSLRYVPPTRRTRGDVFGTEKASPIPRKRGC